MHPHRTIAFLKLLASALLAGALVDFGKVAPNHEGIAVAAAMVCGLYGIFTIIAAYVKL